ncbi:GAF domain-containing protein [candidate division WOR-3 bacterium]|nr:GAF domain-containing protein [candidate division WOR-3 bacterium]
MAGKAKKPQSIASRRERSTSSTRSQVRDNIQSFDNLLASISSGKSYDKGELERIAGKTGQLRRLVDAFIQRETELEDKIKTERKRSEKLRKKVAGLENLERSDREILYKELFEQAHDAIFIENEAEEIVEVNKRASELTGYTRSQLLQMRTRDLQTDEFKKGKTLEVYSTDKPSEAEVLETVIVNRNGSEIPVHLTLAPLKFDERKLVLSIVREISDIKRAEEALAERERLYRTLVNTAQDAIIHADEAENILFANPAAAELLGVDSEKLVGRSFYDFLSPEESKILVDQSKRRMKGETSRYELGLKCKDGSRRDVLVTAAPIYDSAGKVTSSMGVLTDITERKRALKILEREHKAFRIIAEASVQGADIPDVCTRIVSGLTEALGFDAGTFRSYEGETLRLEASFGLTAKEEELAAEPQSVKDNRFVAALTARTKKPIIVSDASKEKSLEPFTERLGKFKERSLISWPVTGSKGHLLGVLHFWAKSRKNISAGDTDFFERIAGMFANVLERRITEDALKGSEEKHRTLIMSIRSPVVALTEDAGVLYCNDSFAGLFHRKAEKIEGRNFLEVMPGFSETEFYKAYLETLKTAKASEVDALLGSRHFHARIFRTPWGVLLIAEDVTDRKSAEAELERYTRSMEGLYELVKQINLSVDLADMFTRITPLLEDNPGVIAGGIYLIDGASLSLERGFGPSRGFYEKNDTIEVRAKGAAEVLNTRSAVIVSSFAGAEISEVKFKREKGTMVGVSLRSADDLLGAFYMILAGTDDYTLAFMEMLGSEIGTGVKRKLVEDAMRDSEERFRSVYENVPIGMYRTTPDGRIIMANPAMLDMLGCKGFHELAKYDLESGGKYGPQYDRSVFKESIEREERIVGWETVLKKLDGSTITVRENAKVVRDEEGNPLYYEGTLEDITQLSVINEISRAISSTLDVKELYGIIHNQLKRLITADNFYIALYDERTDEVSFPYVFQDGGVQEWATRKAGKGMTEYVIRKGKAQLFAGDKSDAYQKGTELIGKPSESWLGVPMIIRDKVIGVMTVQSFDPDIVYSTKEINLMQTVANQASQAVENARAYSNLEQRLTEVSVFTEIARALGSTLQLDELMKLIYNQTKRIMYADNFYVALYDEEGGRIEFPFYIRDGKKVKTPGRNFGQGLTEHVITTREGLLLSSRNAEKTISAKIKRHTVGEAAQSWLGAPMVSHDQVLGIIAVQSTKDPDLYDENHKRLLSSIANQAAGAVANAKAYSALERKLTEQSVFNEIGIALGSVLELDELLKVIYEQTSRVMDTDQLYISLYDEKTNTIEFPLVTEAGKSVKVPSRKFGNSATEYVITTRKPLLIKRDFSKTIEALGLELILEKGEAEPLCWLGVPMISADKVLGVIVVQNVEREEIFGEDDLHTLTTIASQAAGVVANARAYANQERRLTELSVFAEIARALSATLEPEELMKLLHEQTKRLMDADTFYIASYDEDHGIIEFPYFIEDGKSVEVPSRPFRKGLTEYVIRTGEPFLIQHDDFEEECKKRGVEMVVIGSTPLSWLGVPMIARDKVLGIICTQSIKTSNIYDENDKNVLVSIANQAAGMFSNARAYQALGKELTERSVINQISQAISSTLNVDELYGLIHSQIKRLINAENFYIALYERDTDEVIFPYAFQDGSLQEWGSRRSGKGMTEYVISTGKPQLFQKDSAQEATSRGVEHIGKSSSSWLGVPMKIRNEVIGVMTVQSFDPEITYTERDMELMQLVANQAAQAVENARSYSDLEHSLTELSVFSEVGRALGATLNLDELIEVIYTQTSRVMDTQSFYIALHNEEDNTVEFPLFKASDGQRISLPPRKFGKGLTEYVIGSRKSLLLKENVVEEARKIGVEIKLVGNEAVPQSWLGIPMIFHDKVVGVIGVQNTKEANIYDESHQRLLEAISNQAAGAVVNARSYAQIERRLTELSVINEIGRALGTTFGLEDLLEIIHVQISRIMDTENLYIALYDERSESIEFPFAMDDGKRVSWPTRPLGNALTDYIIQTRESLLIKRDVIEVCKKLGIEMVVIGESPLCWLGVPMVSQDKVIGVIAVQSTQRPEVFDEDHERLLESVANQAAGTVANARAYTMLERHGGELRTLFETASAVASVLDEKEVASLIAHKATELIGASGCTVYRYEELANELVAQTTTLKDGRDEILAHRVKPGEGITGKAASERKEILANHVHKDPKSYRIPGTKELPTCLMSVPLISHGKLLGVMTLSRFTDEGFEAHDLELFTLFAAQVADAAANSRLFARLKELNENLERRSEELGTLFKTSTELSSTLDEDEVAKLIAQKSTELIGADGCTVYRYDAAQELLVPQISTNRKNREQVMSFRLKLGQGVTGTAAKDRRPLMKNHVHLTGSSAHVPGTKKEPTCLLSAPLISKGELMGAMTLTRLSEKEFSEHDLQLFTLFARQAAETFANSRLFGRLKELKDNLEKRSEELKTLFDTSTELSSTLDENQVAKIIAERAKSLIPSSGCTFYRYDSEEEKLVPTATTVKEEAGQRMVHKISLGEGVSGRSAELKKPLLENKVHLNPKAPRIPGTDEVHTNIIAIPLMARDELLGDMTITRLYDEDFTTHDLQIATLFARQAEQAVANSRLFSQLKELNEDLECRSQELENLIRVSTGVSSTLDEEEMATYISSKAKELIPSTGCTFYSFNSATGKLVPMTTTVMEEYEERMAYNVPLGEGITGTAARDRQTIMANRVDLSPDAVCVPGTENLPTSIISSPLEARGELIGALTLVRISEETYSDHDKQIFSLFTRQVAEAFANCRLFSQMRDFSEALEQKVSERTRELERAKFKLEDVHAEYKDRVKSRLETIAPILEKVGKGDFSETIPMPEKADEFTDLFRNLNLMIFDMQNLVDENLSKADELQRLNEDLEAQVAERTLDLESAHEQLKVIHAAYRDRVNGYLAMLSPVLEKVGRWDFSQSLPAEEITDEFKDLFDGLNRMIENLRFMVDENNRRSEALKTLLDTNTEVSILLDESKVTEVVVKRAKELFHADACTVYKYDPQANNLIPQITTFTDMRDEVLSRKIPMGEGITGRVAAVRESICESKIKSDILEFPKEVTKGKPVSMMAAPMVSQGELIGVMSLVRFGEDGFLAHRDMELFQLFALQVADAAANSRLFEKLNDLNEKLESKVAQRTAELEVANKKLKEVHDSYQERVRQRLSTIAPVMEKVSLGDFSENIPVHETEDEFTELFVGLNLMIDDLRFMFDENRRRSEELKDLNEDLKSRSEELREREQLYRTLVQTAQEAITLADDEENIIFANPALGDLLGYDPSDLVGMTLLDFMPEEERDFVRAQTSLRHKGETSRYELTLIHKEGIKRNVLVTAAPIYDADGNYTASMGILTDITDRKRSEQERQTLLETTTEVAATLDEVKVSGLIAQRAKDLIKADRCTIYKYDSQNEILVPQTTTAKSRDRKKVLSYSIGLGEGVTGKAASERKPILANNVHTDPDASRIPGTPERPTCLLCTPLISKGELLGVMTLTRLSENEFEDHDLELLTLLAGQVADAMANSRLHGQLRELNENLEEMVARRTAELEESNRKTKAFARELEEVIYVTSHDLKTPLRAISGFSQFLFEDYNQKLDAKAQLYLTRLIDSTKRMERLLDDLLNISAISRSKEAFETIPAGELIKEAVLMVDTGEDVDIIFEPEELPTVYCDRAKIVEVFFNLIGNGLKFNNKPRKRVKISARSSDGFHEFTVEDNGIGIEKRHYERIFKIFQRLHQREAYEGTGVGLSMVKRVIEEHNGRIWVESQVGTGTIFHFTLPERNDGTGENAKEKGASDG